MGDSQFLSINFELLFAKIELDTVPGLRIFFLAFSICSACLLPSLLWLIRTAPCVCSNLSKADVLPIR